MYTLKISWETVQHLYHRIRFPRTILIFSEITTHLKCLYSSNSQNRKFFLNKSSLLRQCKFRFYKSNRSYIAKQTYDLPFMYCSSLKKNTSSLRSCLLLLTLLKNYYGLADWDIAPPHDKRYQPYHTINFGHTLKGNIIEMIDNITYKLWHATRFGSKR